ncbi:MAG: TolB family protein [Chitinophagales bacterium]
MKSIFPFIFVFLSFASFGQAGSEIYLFDLKLNNGQVILSNGINITNHKGYDNQPSFHPSKPIIYYSSFNDSGRSDIRYYNYETKETKNLTVTHEREYSPTVTPDSAFISCIIQRDNGAQDLAKFPIGGGKPETLVWHLKVGYHAWVAPSKVFLFVLDDSIHNSLHNYDVSKNTDTVIAENIGRSLFRIPRENALSYVQKLANNQNVIKRYDLATGVSSPIINTLPGQDFFCWVQPNSTGDQKRIMLSSDGTRIFSYETSPFTEFNEKTWQLGIIEGNTTMVKNITRMAANADNTKLAVVVGE